MKGLDSVYKDIVVFVKEMLKCLICYVIIKDEVLYVMFCCNYVFCFFCVNEMLVR